MMLKVGSATSEPQGVKLMSSLDKGDCLPWDRTGSYHIQRDPVWVHRSVYNPAGMKRTIFVAHLGSKICDPTPPES